MELETTCPYCGAPLLLAVDESAGSRQRYVEDCQVCCQPIDVDATIVSDEDWNPDVTVTAKRADE